MTGDHSVNFLASHDLVCILQTDVFCRPPFKDIDLNILGSISGVEIDNCAKFREVTIPRRYISRKELSKRFQTLQTHNFQIRWVISKTFGVFVPLHGAWHLVKISFFILLVVQEAVTTPLLTCKPMLKHLLVNYKGIFYFSERNVLFFVHNDTCALD